MNVVVISGKPGLVLRKVKGKMKTSTVETRDECMNAVIFRARPGPLSTEPVLLNVYGAPALIPRNEFRQPM